MERYKQVFIKNLNNTLCKSQYKYIVYNSSVYTVSSIIQGMAVVLYGGDNQFMKDFLNSVLKRGHVFVSDDASGSKFSIIRINIRTNKPGTKK